MWSVGLYGSEIWIVVSPQKVRLDVFKSWRYRRIVIKKEITLSRGQEEECLEKVCHNIGANNETWTVMNAVVEGCLFPLF